LGLGGHLGLGRELRAALLGLRAALLELPGLLELTSLRRAVSLELALLIRKGLALSEALVGISVHVSS
jgi:hypothetical protein